MSKVLNYKDAVKHGHLIRELNGINYDSYDEANVALSLLAIDELIETPRAITGIGKLSEHFQKLAELYTFSDVIKAIIFRMYEHTQMVHLDSLNKQTQSNFLIIKHKIEKICEQLYPQAVESWFQKRFNQSFKDELNVLPEAKDINPNTIHRLILVNKSQVSDPEIIATIRNIFTAKSYCKTDSSKTPENIHICNTAEDVIAKANQFQVEKLDILGHVPRFRQVYSSNHGPINIVHPFKMGDIIGSKECVGAQIGLLINNACSLKKVRLFSCFSAGESSEILDRTSKTLIFSHVTEDSLLAHTISTMSQQRKNEVKLTATPYAVAAIPSVLTKPFFAASKSGDFLWRSGKYVGGDEVPLQSNLWLHYQAQVTTLITRPSASG